MSSLTLFRVHFADGTTTDVEAATPKDAKAVAEKRHTSHIRKIKVVREAR